MEGTILGKSLINSLGCEIPLVQDVLSTVDKRFYGLTVEQLNESEDEVIMSIIRRIADMETLGSVESADDIKEQPVRAIFCYGTLRADYCEAGDRWGVISKYKSSPHPCVWHRAQVSGFLLFQNPRVDYPFATPSKDGKLVGTVLTWPSDSSGSVFADALQQCNAIEGYSSSGNGLYTRKTVQAHTEHGDVIDAFIYYQNINPECKQRSEYLTFPTGNWLGR